jgi:hypothetical protein
MKANLISENDRLRSEGVSFNERMKLLDFNKLSWIEKKVLRLKEIGRNFKIKDFDFINYSDIPLYREAGLESFIEYYYRLGTFLI